MDNYMSLSLEAQLSKESKSSFLKVQLILHFQTLTSDQLLNIELTEIQHNEIGCQHKIMEMVWDSAHSMNQCIQALKRRFSNLKGTLMNLMRVALGVKRDEEDQEEKKAPKELDSEEEGE
ncbi:hypothetical protein FB446DRAFT_709252 [Lentinula raphanica]|nr:hypothetical protein FB446DRAFT_709252 [Lentinula raphanica]